MHRITKRYEADRRQPHRRRTVERSNDPAFAAKVEDIPAKIDRPPEPFNKAVLQPSDCSGHTRNSHPPMRAAPLPSSLRRFSLDGVSRSASAAFRWADPSAGKET
ncbi:hypothetical protein GAY29_09150 [Azospirillum brasilense]|nr:hypothetical protein [Azospirillum brasilense]